MTMMDENDLRRRFAELRDADRESAPDFAETYDRAVTDPISRLQENRGLGARTARRPRLRVRRLVIGAAAAVVLAILMDRARSLSPDVMPEVASWRAPTDVLLDTPGSELLGTMPALGESILDKMIPTYSLRGS
jgi:ferric-dicitrate binding protein FerR (iron transport regulator)